MIQIRSHELPSQDQLLALYGDAGWSAYTGDPRQLMRAYAASLLVLTAWDGPRLAGALRAVGDGETILYIQDLLVLSSHQRRGIGRSLLRACLERYAGVRQKVLLTDDTPGTKAFYQACGLVPAAETGCVAFLWTENTME